jgi:predicted secreted protein
MARALSRPWSMMSHLIRRFAIVASLACTAAWAQQPAPGLAPHMPAVTVTGAASTKVANDRMQALLRAEAEQPTAAAAAAEVNARMAKALAAARSSAGIEAKTVGYNTWQQWDKGRPGKWRVAQTLSLAGADFPVVAALVSRLQDEEGLLVSGIGFALAPETRRRAEDALTREAIAAWQERARTAADALGYRDWRPGRLIVSTGEHAPQPRFEMMARAADASPASRPVAVEGGTTEITVTVSGDALLERPPGR